MQRLLWFLGWGVALSAAPFPHKLHLAQGLACVGCHTTATASTRATDDLLPKREVCFNCHENPIVPATHLRGPVPVARFNHAMHLRMGDISRYIASAIDHKTYLQPAGDIRAQLNPKNPCEACHRGLEQSVEITRAVLPQMADCLVCHTQIDPPFSCEDCHAKDAAIKPASHVEHFIDRHSAGKMALDKSTCAVCHGREFRCMGCH